MKLMQMDFEFQEKNYKTQINQLKHENSRLKDLLQTEKDSVSTELQKTLDQ